MIDQDLDTAYHEAGHAVLGCVVGRCPLSVTIERDGDIAGLTLFEADVPDVARSYLNESAEKRRYTEQRVLTELAGTIAHNLFKPSREEDVGDKADLHFTRQLISELVSWEDQDDYLRQSQARAADILRLHWKWVEAVASALYERKTLSRTDILGLKPLSEELEGPA